MKKLLKDCLYIFFIVSVLFFITDQPSFSRNIKFAQLSDIHYSDTKDLTDYKMLSKTKPLLEDAISQINNINNLDFVMITGDGIDKPNKESINSLILLLNKLNYPWYYAIGNHDITIGGFLTKANLIKILKEKNQNFKFDSTYYTFKPKKGFRIIVMDGARNECISSNGLIPEEELCWLDEILKDSKKDTVLIFIHYPLLPPFESKYHKILNDKEFKKVLEKYNMPIAIFSGHYHTTKIKKRGNILHVSSPSLFWYPNAFRIVTVENKRKQVIFKFDFHETNLKDFQTKTKIMTLGGAKYYGKPEDRNTTIIMERKYDKK